MARDSGQTLFRLQKVFCSSIILLVTIMNLLLNRRAGWKAPSPPSRNYPMKRNSHHYRSSSVSHPLHFSHIQFDSPGHHYSPPPSSARQHWMDYHHYLNDSDMTAHTRRTDKRHSPYPKPGPPYNRHYLTTPYPNQDVNHRTDCRLTQFITRALYKHRGHLYILLQNKSLLTQTPPPLPQ